MKINIFGLEVSISKKPELKQAESLEAQEAVHILKNHFLGEKWYIEDPVCNTQANAIIVYEILRSYPSPKWPKKWKTKGERT